jgi:uncharacterized protein (TIGR02001 family)
MKTVLRTGLLLSLISATGVANADWSANINYASEYYYRGFFQKNSSANGGVDFESGGFYLGTWAADVGDGLEVDVYGGYGFDVGEFSLGAGFTGYYYTGDFDDTYQEINLNAAIAGFTLDVAVGQYDNFGGPTQDYTFYSLTYERSGFYGKYGAFSQDFSGSYFEAGYGTTISDIDLGLSLVFPDDDITGDGRDEAIVFTIGKSFDL